MKNDLDSLRVSKKDTADSSQSNQKINKNTPLK